MCVCVCQNYKLEMSHKLFYKPDTIYAHCGYGNRKQNLIFHCINDT